MACKRKLHINGDIRDLLCKAAKTKRKQVTIALAGFEVSVRMIHIYPHTVHTYITNQRWFTLLVRYDCF